MIIIRKFFEILSYIRHPKRFIYPNTYSSERFVDFLRSKGAVIGLRTRFISPSNCVVDPGRIDYISIGDDCCLSNVTILAHDYSWYVFLDAYKDIVPDAGGQVTIGNNVFIGYQSCVLKGTEIGDNVIIGARSVVKGKIPSNTVWCGVPAKQLCTLDEFYEKRVKMKMKNALNRRDFIRKKYGRDPSIEELGPFCVLFLERTDENWNKYVKKIQFNGIADNEKLREFFYSSAPMFKSYSEFLKINIET